MYSSASANTSSVGSRNITEPNAHNLDQGCVTGLKIGDQVCVLQEKRFAAKSENFKSPD